MSRSRLAALFLFGVSCFACTALLGDFTVVSSGPDDGVDGGGEGGGGLTSITPTEARIGILRSQTFAAVGDVTWSVQEGDAAGTIDAAGKFISTDKVGIVHVVATSKADPKVTSTATVTVVPLGIVALVGQNGGAGNIDGTATRAHFHNPAGIGYFGNGRSIFVIADTQNHTIRKFDEAAGKSVTLAGASGVTGTADGDAVTARFNQPSSIAIDEDGDKIFVLDASNHCIRRVDLQTGQTGTLAGQCGTTGHVDGSTGGLSRFADVHHMILAPFKDALYVCEIADSAGYRGVRRIELPGGKTTSVVSGLNGCDIAADNFGKKIYFTNGADQKLNTFADSATINPVITPVAPLPGGDFFTESLAVMTGFGGSNDVYYRKGTTILHWAIGSAAFDATPFFGAVDDKRVVDGNQTIARLSGPYEIVPYGPQGKLFLADANAIRVIETNPTPKQLTTKIGAAAYPANVDGPRNSARFSAPFAVTTDDAGNFYIADQSFEQVLSSTIRKFAPVSGTVSTLAGAPNKNDPALDGPHDQAKFKYPFDLVYAGGKLYVADILASAIRQVDVGTGEVKTIAGELNVAGTGDGVGAAAHFKFLSGGDGAGGGIATDGTNLYVADTYNFSIRKILIATGEVTTLAGGTKGSVNGVGVNAQFQMPIGLTYDNGFVYVADSGDSTIRRVDVKTGEVTGFMGLSMQVGAVDGDAATATFTSPIRVTADHLGNLYVAELNLAGNDNDQFFSTIRRVDIKNRRSSLFAGDRKLHGLGTGSLPSTMNCPLSFSITPKGDLAFADYCELEIGVIQPL